MFVVQGSRGFATRGTRTLCGRDRLVSRFSCPTRGVALPEPASEVRRRIQIVTGVSPVTVRDISPSLVVDSLVSSGRTCGQSERAER